MRTMKVQRVVLPWALLSAGFLLGCQEQGSSPAGPDGLAPQFAKGKPCPGHPSCKPGDDPATTSTLDFSGGMGTTGLPVTVKDRTDQLEAGNTDFAHHIQMALYDNRGTCVGFKATKSGVLPSTDPSNDEVAKLEAELKGAVEAGFFIMQIDKTGLESPSGGNLLDVERDGTFDDAPGTTHGTTRIMLGSPFDQVGDVTVKQPGTNLDVFEFTGPVVVWAHGVGGRGGEKSNRIIQCDGGGGGNANKVVVTVHK